MTDTLTGIWSAGVDDPRWQTHRDTEWGESVLAWMREQGMDPTCVYSISVYLVDAPFARVDEWRRNEDGHLYIDPDTGEPAWHTATYPLTSLPPEWPKETT